MQTSRGKMKLRRNIGIKEINPIEELLNEELISHALWDSLKEGDDKGFKEVVLAYVEACKKAQTAKKAAKKAIEEQIDLDAVRKALADIKKHGTISWEVIKQKLNL